MAGGGSSAAAVVAVVVVVLMLLVGSPNYIKGVEGAVTCGDVTRDLIPCMVYLRGGQLAPTCCDGVKKLQSAAKTPDDRRTACRCLLSASKAVSGVNFRLAASLPSKCGVSIPYKISPSTDCNKVN